MNPDLLIKFLCYGSRRTEELKNNCITKETWDGLLQSFYLIFKLESLRSYIFCVELNPYSKVAENKDLEHFFSDVFFFMKNNGFMMSSENMC